MATSWFGVHTILYFETSKEAMQESGEKIRQIYSIAKIFECANFMQTYSIEQIDLMQDLLL